jgi:predicted Zn-dependent protease
MPTAWRAEYFDGRTPERHAVVVEVLPTGLQIQAEAGASFWWPYADVRQSQGTYEGEPVRLQRGGELPETLVVRDPAFLADLARAAPDFRRRFHDPARRRWRVPLTALAAVAVLVLAVVIYRWGIPALATAVAAVVPVRWEEQLGQGVVSRLAPEGRRCTGAGGLAAIDTVMARLVAGQRVPYTFRVYVVDGEMVNAFAAPGGFVVLFRGLVERARSAEEVAGVLAHEAQHVLRRHATRRIVQHASTGILLGALVGDPTGAYAYGVEAARLLGTLEYTRRHEEEADAEGMRMLLAARVDPAGMIGFFEAMARERGSAPSFLAYLSTHPPTAERLARLRALAAGAAPPEPLLTGEAWTALRQVCGERPREPRRR